MFRVRVPNDIVYNVTSDQSVIYYVNVNHIFFILMRRCYFCNWWIYKKYTTASDKTNIHTFDCKMGWFMHFMHFKNAKKKKNKNRLKHAIIQRNSDLNACTTETQRNAKLNVCIESEHTTRSWMLHIFAELNGIHLQGAKYSTHCIAMHCTVLHFTAHCCRYLSLS